MQILEGTCDDPTTTIMWEGPSGLVELAISSDGGFRYAYSVAKMPFEMC